MLFSALLLKVWTLCLDLTLLHLISHFSTCLHVLISSSSLLIDFSPPCFIFALLCHFSILFQASLNPIIAQPLLCASDVGQFVIKSALFCFVLMYARFVNFFSTTSCTYMYLSITCFILPSPLLDAHAFAE